MPVLVGCKIGIEIKKGIEEMEINEGDERYQGTRKRTESTKKVLGRLRGLRVKRRKLRATHYGGTGVTRTVHVTHWKKLKNVPKKEICDFEPERARCFKNGNFRT